MIGVPLLVVRTGASDPASQDLDGAPLARDLCRCVRPVCHVSVVSVEAREVAGMAFVTDDTSLAELWAARHVDRVLAECSYEQWERRQPQVDLLHA